MFQVNEVNVPESILFLGSTRLTIAEIVKSSSLEEKKNLSNFILNEASDYQVMSLLMGEELPEKKSNIFEEERLFDDLKDLITANYLELTELVSGDVLNTIVHRVGSITPKGLSSAPPLLEFAVERGPASEKYFWEKVLQEQFSPEDLEGPGIDPAKVKAAWNWLKAISPITIKKDPKAVAKVQKAIAATKAVGADVADKVKDADIHLKNLIRAKVGADPKRIAGLEKQIASQKKLIKSLNAKSATISDTLKTLGTQLKQAMSAKYAAGAAAAKGVAAKGATAAQAAKGTAVGAVKGLPAAGVAALKAIGAKTGAGAVATKVGVGAAGAPVVGGAAVVIGATVLAAILTYAAVKTYQRYWSKAGAACRGRSGKEKTVCLKKYRVNALKAQLIDLKKGMTACTKSQDPKKCGKLVGARLAKVTKQLAKAQTA